MIVWLILALAGIVVVAYICFYIMYSYNYDCMLQVNRGWTVSEVRQWAQRTALLGASGFLVLAGFVDIPGQ